MLTIEETEDHEGFQESIQDISQALDLSDDVLQQAIQILEEYRDQFKSNEEYLPPAAIHIASRLEDEPRTQKMIVDYLEQQRDLFSCDGGQLQRGVRENVKKLRKLPDINLSLVRSKQYLDYIVSQLQHVDVSNEVFKTAEQYCETIEKRSGVARSKVAIAGTCLKKAIEESSEHRSVTHAQLASATAMNRSTFQNNLEYFRENNLLEDTRKD